MMNNICLIHHMRGKESSTSATQNWKERKRKWHILSPETPCASEMCSTVCKLCYVGFVWHVTVLAQKGH